MRNHESMNAANPCVTKGAPPQGGAQHHGLGEPAAAVSRQPRCHESPNSHGCRLDDQAGKAISIASDASRAGCPKRQQAAAVHGASRKRRSSWLGLVASLSVHGVAFAVAAHFLAGGAEGDASSSAGAETGDDLSLSVKVAAFAPKQPRQEEHRLVTNQDVIRKALPAQQQRIFAARQTDFALPPPALPEPMPPEKSTPTESPKTVAAADEPPAKKASRPSSKRGSGSSKGATGSGSGAGAGNGSGIASAPRPLSTKLPVYPYASKKRSEEGLVLVRVRVNEAGRVESSTLYKSCGHPALDDAAVACVWKWTFAPGQAAGKAVASSAVVRVSFRLEG